MKKHLVVLSGAGMSAESGLSTFRDSNGLWANYRVEDVATPEGFARNPQLVLDFYNKRRREMWATHPNNGHIGLVQLETLFDVQIITQNVDNLHERAGSSNVLHLHGELTKSCPIDNLERVYEINPQYPDLHLGDVDERGVQLRPYIVWFGEAVPMIEPAITQTLKADIFVIIGTSLNVYPAAGLIDYVSPDSPIFLIDPQEVNTHYNHIRHIRKGAVEGVRELISIIEQEQLWQ